MKPDFTRIPAALARLAFWRKSAAVDAGPASADPEPAQRGAAAVEPSSPDHGLERIDASEAPAPARPGTAADGAKSADLAPEPPTFLARLIARLRRPKAETADASPPIEPVTPVEAAGEADPAAASFLARLAAKLRRRPAVDAPSADEALDSEDESAPRGFRRVLALLSRKIVWVPAASLVLLAVVGTLSALLWQAGQDRTALEAKLKAAEQQLQRTAAPRPRPAGSTPAPSASADAAAPAAGLRPKLAGGDCDINDAESVPLRLKDCIAAFNLETAGPRPARATQANP